MPEEGKRRISATYRMARFSPGEVSGKVFSTTRKGYDPTEVRTFLEMIGRELEATLEREAELREALADAEHRAANPEMDEATLTTALGKETARVLRSAHDAAGEVISRAESDALRTRQQALEEAETIRTQADQYAADKKSQADSASADMLKQANEEVVAKLESARLEGESMISQSKAECRMMVKEAQELRSKILGDMSARRALLKDQIGRLNAAKSRMADLVLRAKGDIKRITEELLPEDSAVLDDLDAGYDDAHITTSPSLDTGDNGQVHAGGSAGIQARGALAGEAVRKDVVVSGNEGSGGSDSPVDGNDSGSNSDDQISDLGSAVEGSRTQLVDEIFARLRAAKPVAQGGGPDGDREGGGQPVAQGGGPDGDREGGQHDVDHHPLFTARNDALHDAVDSLSRKLKRTLQDYQNELLDRIRTEKGWSDTMLPSAGERLDSMAMLCIAGVETAAKEGMLSVLCVDSEAGEAADEVGQEHEKEEKDWKDGQVRKLMESVGADLRDLADEISSTILNALSKRIEDGSIDLATADVDSLVGHVGAAWREGRGARVEQAVEDRMVAAFSLGQVVTGQEMDIPFRWISTTPGQGCPDCEDNVLSDPLGGGQEFPTGHLYPPAHTGCRCLLEPAILLREIQ
ncbi:MAG: DivIVA domain-containing protein [Actinobacteria bacterium]|nr:DivIVA domain-containing protein [Actinomycetota bacterium]MCL5447417.1 DivIVA domain-containing protein [Actinomycetota bacterium]